MVGIDSGRAAPLPVMRARRAAVIAEHAQQLLDGRGLDGEERVRLAGVLRACGAAQRGSTTLPNVSDRQIVNASAREVAALWERTHGVAPWGQRPFLLRWLDR